MLHSSTPVRIRYKFFTTEYAYKLHVHLVHLGLADLCESPSPHSAFWRDTPMSADTCCGGNPHRLQWTVLVSRWREADKISRKEHFDCGDVLLRMALRKSGARGLSEVCRQNVPAQGFQSNLGTPACFRLKRGKLETHVITYN